MGIKIECPFVGISAHTLRFRERCMKGEAANRDLRTIAMNWTSDAARATRLRVQKSRVIQITEFRFALLAAGGPAVTSHPAAPCSTQPQTPLSFQARETEPAP
jgi:hypothetical protein